MKKEGRRHPDFASTWQGKNKRRHPACYPVTRLVTNPLAARREFDLGLQRERAPTVDDGDESRRHLGWDAPRNCHWGHRRSKEGRQAGRQADRKEGRKKGKREEGEEGE